MKGSTKFSAAALESNPETPPVMQAFLQCMCNWIKFLAESMIEQPEGFQATSREKLQLLLRRTLGSKASLTCST